ncbi:MAG: hypothetical protein EP338_01625 [Bacteroidetes bacterium]|nr:MAG: hypothetical protein EP338_01625 [Bacteroidota bacterium]
MINQIKKNITSWTEEELFQFRIILDSEFKARGVKFSVGEIGENTAVNYFNKTAGLPNLQKAPTGVKNVDALSRDGHRYSIKTVQNGKKTGTIYPDKDENLQLFEYLLIVQLDENYEMKEMHRFSWKQFVKQRAWDSRMNAWYIPVSSTRLSKAEKIYPNE